MPLKHFFLDKEIQETITDQSRDSTPWAIAACRKQFVARLASYECWTVISCCMLCAHSV